MKNYLSNMFTTIKNNQLAKRSFVYCPRKNICETFLKILWKEGFIIGYKISTKNLTKLKIFLKYQNNKPVINSIKILSKPGSRIYCTTTQIWKINSNDSLVIFSTNKGLKSIFDCKKYKLGGEPFIKIN